MGTIISARRKEKGMSQKNLAEKINITDKAVSNCERDMSCPDNATIPKLEEILDISIDELLSEKNCTAIRS